MSRASKITFALSCVFTASTVVGVHIVQGLERDTFHQGPIKDAQRVAARKQQRLAAEADTSRNCGKNTRLFSRYLGKLSRRMAKL